MWKKLIPYTIRGRIMILTAIVTLLITVITTTICFLVFQSFLRKNQFQSTEFSLQVVSNNIAADMKDIIYFSKWCCSNDEIIDYLETFKNLPKLPTADKDSKNLRLLALSTHNRLKEEYYNTRSNEYISRVIISTVNQRNFLQIAPKANSTSPYAAKTISKESFYNPLYSSNHFLWIGLIHDPFSNINQEQFIPIVRPIYNKFNTEVIGWTYVEISSRIFTDYLTASPLPEDSSLSITIGGNRYELVGSGLHFVHLKDVEKRDLVQCPIEGMNGWSLSQILSKQQLKEQKRLYTLLIFAICFFIVSLGVLLAFLLNRLIMEPIHHLSNKIEDISNGDFTRNEAIEWDHELGQIGRGINNMSENIIALMEKRITDEKQKKDLEYQILQNQINPHFLYNTLNSIKWMATIQNANGIADMTTALARLLKNVSKGTNTLIPLREELELVKDYFLIQQYRYGGSVTISYDIGEELFLCRIHRFTLQPIIENSLFHGIEPKETTGKITVCAETIELCSKKALLIRITDDGIGMSPEMIEQVLHSDAKSKKNTEFFQHVGIGNVNKRIQYDFGSNYGITITSRQGEFTSTEIRLPYMLDS
ncbi:histidine kinase [Clostridium sp. E02]|uniref:sensor histidine kinase n=1 Tax=Clostridium sp. E02 TaxID=2487134 RepID=UPI000F51D59F|nr:histidine kinase [Clostridium sp. E02]